jgi:hypothetical protein
MRLERTIRGRPFREAAGSWGRCGPFQSSHRAAMPSRYESSKSSQDSCRRWKDRFHGGLISSENTGTPNLKRLRFGICTFAYPVRWWLILAKSLQMIGSSRPGKRSSMVAPLRSMPSTRTNHELHPALVISAPVELNHMISRIPAPRMGRP